MLFLLTKQYFIVLLAHTQLQMLILTLKNSDALLKRNLTLRNLSRHQGLLSRLVALLVFLRLAYLIIHLFRVRIRRFR